jgi:adenylylsulfate kinase-like enzyme
VGAIHRVIPSDQHGVVYWFHGPSGSGKTRLAIDFAKPGWLVIDADDQRDMLAFVDMKLSFTREDRMKQNMILAERALNASKQGIHVCVASICPYVELRQAIKTMIPWINWVCVFGPDSKSSTKEHPFEEGGWR